MKRFYKKSTIKNRKPRILMVCQYFPPEIGAPQARISEMATYWTLRGYEVTILTGVPNHPDGQVPIEYRGLIRRTELFGDVVVVRTGMYTTPNKGIFKKTLSHISFMFSSLIFGYWKLGRIDIVVVSSPTFFSIISAWIISIFKRCKLIVEVRDLWPGIFVELGVLKNKTVIRILEKMELFFYRVADRVVVVTDGFKDNISSRGISREKIVVIKNGVDLSRFTPQGRVDKCRMEMRADSTHTVVLYVGVHGISQDLDSLISVADMVKDDGLKICLIGNGAERERLKERVANERIENVTMLQSVPRDIVVQYLNSADILIVSLKAIPLFDSFIPSKIFEYMAVAKPIVGLVTGEPAAILKKGGAMVVKQNDLAALKEALIKLSVEPKLREDIGLRSMEYVRKHHNREVMADDYIAIFKSLEEK